MMDKADRATEAEAENARLRTALEETTGMLSSLKDMISNHLDYDLSYTGKVIRNAHAALATPGDAADQCAEMRRCPDCKPIMVGGEEWATQPCDKHKPQPQAGDAPKPDDSKSP